MLRAQSVRVIPALLGRTPSALKSLVSNVESFRLGDVLKSPKYRLSEMILPVALGVDTLVNPVVEDLVPNATPLIAAPLGPAKRFYQ